MLLQRIRQVYYNLIFDEHKFGKLNIRLVLGRLMRTVRNPTLVERVMMGVIMTRLMRLRPNVGGSTGPGCSLMRFDLEEKIIHQDKMTHLSSGISAAI